MRYLLDVNVLIALFDPDHSFHRRAHEWWGDAGHAWASCPLTENGMIRIISSARYSRVARIPPSDLADRLDAFAKSTDHEFWPDALSLRDRSRFDLQSVLSAQSLTDAYLLALATVHDGRLVTFDRSIPIAAVSGADSERIVVL